MMLKEQLGQIIEHLTYLRLEAALIVGATLLLVVGLINKKNLVARIGFAVVVVGSLFFAGFNEETQWLFTKSIVTGPMESVLKMLFLAFSVWIVFYAEAEKRTSEFYFLILSILIGSIFMMSANHLLVIYIALELTSFTGYVITNFNFQKRSFEAGIKYLLFGGVSSAVTLYGFSIIYGMGGSLTISELYFNEANPFLAIGLLSMLAGILFKVSIFPFHIWTPSTYQEAPTDAVAVLSVVPKIAGFVLLNRVISIIDMNVFGWVQPLLVVIGVATIAVGTLGALGQTNVKRLFAYGAIAHSGLLLACLLIDGKMGATAFFWYAMIYAIMNLVMFYLASLYESQGVTDTTGFAGLVKTQPWWGALIVVVMIAQIGLPPTAGFTAKFYLFSALWEAYVSLSDNYLLTYLIVGVVSVIFSLFYYLKIPYSFFIHSAQKLPQIKFDAFSFLLATILSMLLLWFFFSPELLNNIVVKFSSIDW
ncbi:NADH-quinone oxidoreductase subunit N [Marinoscillum sp. MHG1-6]|uniref:NADH-quinone oxidoreductase subunit N n=1 Tax=Marinoscillum sp. MHG1-6 TaxID=2959627 RepID=UPI0021572A27|nr:NADH-quinone oxidoreductase subunit N [Marinoscillum sp. MHG1-6]